jgi:replicative DNA helicase
MNSLPYSEDAEKGLLCSLILQPSLALEPQIRRELFFNTAHRIIFGVVAELAAKVAGIDFPSLVIEVKKLGQLEEVGGPEFLNELLTFIPTASNWRYYYEQVFDTYAARQAHLAALKILELDEPIEQVGVAVEALCSIAAPMRKEPIPFKERIFQTLDWIEESRTTERDSVVKFGIDELDNALKPIEPGDQIVVCSQTGGGKSALACQAVLMSKTANCAIFSLEMHARSLIIRMLAAEGHLPLSNLRTGRLEAAEFARLNQGVERLSSRVVWIEDEHPIDARYVASKCRALAARDGLSLVVVDYLQLVSPAAAGKRDTSREREVAEISRALKSLAQELNVVVLALSQLNDAGQLRESRAIGQDADIVLHIAGDDNGKPERIEIQKHRNGPRCRIPVNFDGRFMRFSESQHDELR